MEAQLIEKPLSTEISEDSLLTQITPNVFISGQLTEEELRTARNKYHITDVYYLRCHDEPGHDPAQRKHADKLGMKQIDFQTSEEQCTLQGGERAMAHVDRFFSRRALRTMLPTENYLFMDGKGEKQRARLFALLTNARFNKGEARNLSFQKELDLLKPEYRKFAQEYVNQRIIQKED